MITFTVTGNPIPKARPRTVWRKGRAVTYTPQRTVDYENQVREMAQRAMGTKLPLRGPVAVTIRIYRQDRRKADGTNIAKAIEDAMNGIVYVDDSQIVEECWFKDIDRSNPRAEVEVEALN